MKKSELKQLIRETVEEVRVISEANKIAAYLKSNPRLVKSLMAHGVLTEAEMGRRDFLKKMGMGLAGAGLTASGLKGATTGEGLPDMKRAYTALDSKWAQDAIMKEFNYDDTPSLRKAFMAELRKVFNIMEKSLKDVSSKSFGQAIAVRADAINDEAEQGRAHSDKNLENLELGLKRLVIRELERVQKDLYFALGEICGW